MKKIILATTLILGGLLGANSGAAEAANCYPSMPDSYHAATACFTGGTAPYRVRAGQWGSNIPLYGPWVYSGRSIVFCPRGCNYATSEIWYG